MKSEMKAITDGGEVMMLQAEATMKEGGRGCGLRF